MSQLLPLPTPGPALAYVVCEQRLALERPRLPAGVRRLLEAIREERPLHEICVELQIPTAKGLRIVEKLIRLGVLRATSDSEDFSETEEAFFASEVKLDPWDNTG